jgi:hypothetical protein
VALRSGTRSRAKSSTLFVVAAAWLAGAADGSIRSRSGDVYKPSVIRGYEQALRLRVLPELGELTLAEMQRADLQAFVDRLLEDEYDPSTIRNTLLPVRAIFRRAVARGEVAVNPTTGLELPAVRGRATGSLTRRSLGSTRLERSTGTVAVRLRRPNSAISTSRGSRRRRGCRSSSARFTRRTSFRPPGLRWSCPPPGDPNYPANG